MTTNGLQIGVAHRDDYEALLTMNTAAVPAVNQIGRDLLETLHRQAEILLVARESGESARPVGFLLALNEDADYGSPNFLYFKNHYPSFAYVDRVVVDARMRGRRIGERLYQALIDHRHNQGLVTCEVNVEPPNPGSLTFHQRMGFKAVGEQATEGGAKRVALMVLTLPGGPGWRTNARLPESDTP